MKKSKTYTRREVFQCLMAGGVITATGMWMPGEKLISIPISIPKTIIAETAGKYFEVDTASQTIKYVGPPDSYISMDELHRYLMKNNPFLMIDNPRSRKHAKLKDNGDYADWLHAKHLGVSPDKPHMDSNIVSLAPGVKFDKPEHLSKGSLMQDSDRSGGMPGEREIWSHWGTFGEVGDEEFTTDKMYVV